MRVGVLLSGCGVEDGSEIYETVLTLLALERAGATVQVMAPDIEQAEVINHYTGKETRLEKRSVLAEAARIVRGKIISAHEVSTHEMDALIIVGGHGVVKNLCNFTALGEKAVVNADVERLIQEMNGLGKPIGAMCIAPVLVALALRNKRLLMTIGGEGAAAVGLSRLGVTLRVTAVDEILVDSANNIVTTAAFMMAQSVSEAESGITQLVNQVLQLARDLVPGRPAPP